MTAMVKMAVSGEVVGAGLADSEVGVGVISTAGREAGVPVGGRLQAMIASNRMQDKV